MTQEPLRAAFSGDFTTLRERFRHAARAAGAVLHDYIHPLHGPSGETLATDVALLGKPDAPKLLVVISGTHGAEAHFGAACQVNWLTGGLAARLPDDTAVLMIHLINPWGAAWTRRVNEDNVDLNRNFIDWSKPVPENEGYARLHPAYACPEWDGPLRDGAEELLASARRELRPAGIASVVWAGQYGFADGLFYGGEAPVWSNRTLNDILARFAGHASHVVAFDLHTGAGPYGHPALLSIAPADHPGLAWGRTAFGPKLSVLLTGKGGHSDTGVAATATGYVSAALLKALPDALVLPLVIECGTLDADVVLDTIRADHWLHLFGQLETPLGQHIKQDMRRAFNPDDEDWRDGVLRRSLRYFDQALAVLGDITPETIVDRQPTALSSPIEVVTQPAPPLAKEGPPAVLVEDLRKRFGTLSVLNGLGMTARAGEVVSIIGSSGSGKSTFLRCINLLEQPDSGHIAIAGEAIRMKSLKNGLSAPADMRQVERIRASVGMVFQNFNLWPHLTVLENLVEAPIHVLREPRKSAIDHAHALLKKVGLSEKHAHYPSQLSGGQQQRAAIARTLAMRPKVMLFDEPTSALDPELVGEVLRVIRQLVEEGNTMILVTHEMQFAREVSSKVLFLHHGKVEEEGPPATLFTNPRSDRLRQFLARTF